MHRKKNAETQIPNLKKAVKYTFMHFSLKVPYLAPNLYSRYIWFVPKSLLLKAPLQTN